MPITSLPTPPTRSDPTNFSGRADTFLAALPNFATQANALEANVDALEAATVTARNEAVPAAQSALAAANYKGLWSSLTGALNIPAAVFHLGRFWVLTANLANVTTAVPGTSSSWVEVLTASPGLRNKLINGAFTVNQRGHTSGAALAAGAFGHDRWKAGSGGCTYTFTQNAAATTVTITAGSLMQVVEEASVEGGSYVISWTGTATGRIATNNGTPSAAYAASPIRVSSASAAQRITVEFTGGTLGLVQLEATGGAPTAFEHRPPAVEIVMARRFYERGTAQGALGAVYSSGFCSFGFQPFQVTKRATPTVTATASAATSGGTFGTVGALSQQVDADGMRLLFTNTGGVLNTIGVADITWTASADL